MKREKKGAMDRPAFQNGRGETGYPQRKGSKTVCLPSAAKKLQKKGGGGRKKNVHLSVEGMSVAGKGRGEVSSSAVPGKTDRCTALRREEGGCKKNVIFRGSGHKRGGGGGKKARLCLRKGGKGGGCPV